MYIERQGWHTGTVGYLHGQVPFPILVKSKSS